MFGVVLCGKTIVTDSANRILWNSEVASRAAALLEYIRFLSALRACRNGNIASILNRNMSFPAKHFLKCPRKHWPESVFLPARGTNKLDL